ncbi:MAG: endolytic transglycosylase MltG [Firmicutes bacterium]|nr:endolytic transglycosylase MltG [Bacillota bacterium]
MKFKLPLVEKKKSGPGDGRFVARLLNLHYPKSPRNPFMLAVASCLLLGILFCWQVNNLLLPVSSGGKEQIVEIDIPLDSSATEIAAILQAKGLIKSAFIFRLYARHRGCDAYFQAGRHQLSPGMTLDEILARLQQGIVLAEGARFTVPEGFTVEQIAMFLARRGLVVEEDFIEECLSFSAETLAFFPPGFPAAEPNELKYALEGYLFPDTYEVDAAATPEEIIATMLGRFAEVFDANYRRRAEELGLSIHEVVTLASLIEREARVPAERPLISAVFHNRLQSEDMPLLQSCATVQYVLGEVKPDLSNDDLAIDSPYNTYLYPRLPPGPIASPGREALLAALYPADVDYLFFVYKEDGSGTHYFSTTLQEHNRYKTLARQNRQNSNANDISY